MSLIYNHYGDKTLVLDPNDNLIFPLGASILGWNELRIAFALSVTQSLSNNNAGFNSTESLSLSAGSPLVNNLAIGIKSSDTLLPGEEGCKFAGIISDDSTNGATTIGFCQGSSYGLQGGQKARSTDGNIRVSLSDTKTFSAYLQYTGANYIINTTPVECPISLPISLEGAYIPSGQNVTVGSTDFKVAQTINDGDTSVWLQTYDGTVEFAPASLVIDTEIMSDFNAIAMGVTDGESKSISALGYLSDGIQFPPSTFMVSPSDYSTILVLSFKLTGRNTAYQAVTVGYNFYSNITDTSKENLEYYMSTMGPNAEYTQYLNGSLPNCLYIHWPFNDTRLRIHSIGAIKYD